MFIRVWYPYLDPSSSNIIGDISNNNFNISNNIGGSTSTGNTVRKSDISFINTFNFRMGKMYLMDPRIIEYQMQ